MDVSFFDGLAIGFAAGLTVAAVLLRNRSLEEGPGIAWARQQRLQAEQEAWARQQASLYAEQFAHYQRTAGVGQPQDAHVTLRNDGELGSRNDGLPLHEHLDANEAQLAKLGVSTKRKAEKNG